MREKFKILWQTDPHCNNLFPWQRLKYISKLKKEAANGLILSGDISNGVMLIHDLKMYAKLGIPTYFCLGNHEYFWSSRKTIAQKVRQFCAEYPYMVWLEDQEEPIRLDEEIAIIGVGGWFDAKYGDIKWLNWKSDWWLIKEFRQLKSLEERVEYSRQLAKESTKTLKKRLLRALELDYKTIYIVTHFPPWLEATRDEGTIMEQFWLPYNTNIGMGKMIEEVMADYKKRNAFVLAGHIHQELFARISRNVQCQVGRGKYLGVPHSQKIYL